MPLLLTFHYQNDISKELERAQPSERNTSANERFSYQC